MIPWQNAFQKAVMPRQFEALAQESCRMRVDSIHCRIYAISPWAQVKTTTMAQTQTVPNMFFYLVHDDEHLLPGCNITPKCYDSGEDELGHGNAPLKPWKIPAFPQTCQIDEIGNLRFMEPNLNLFNHPSFQLVRQTDELNFSWKNSAYEDWFHPAFAFQPTANAHFMGALYNVTSKDTKQHTQGVVENIFGGHKSNFWSPNLWGGNPLWACAGDYGKAAEGKANYPRPGAVT